MASPHMPLRPQAHAGADRIVLICTDLHRIAKYERFLAADGFEVLPAFNAETGLATCRRSVDAVRAAVILTRGESGGDEDLVRKIASTAPSTPCILVPPETSAPECAVLIRIAMRCTAGSLGLPNLAAL